MKTKQPDTLFILLDKIQGIARNGLKYTQNPYDRERYEHLFDTALQSYSELLELPFEDIQTQFRKNLGYITPTVGSMAALFNDQEELLLMDRADGTGWCLPCGYIEAGESPLQALFRETMEETGLEVEVQKLVGYFWREANASNPHGHVSLLFLCKSTGGELKLSVEGKELKYWQIDRVPRWHHEDHRIQAQAALEMHLEGGCLAAKHE